jgi:hypothetical protein
LRHLPERLRDLVEFFGQFAVALALLARLEVGGKRPPAFFNDARQVARKRLDVDRADFHRLLGGSSHQRFLELLMGLQAFSNEALGADMARSFGPRKASFQAFRRKKMP